MGGKLGNETAARNRDYIGDGLTRDEDGDRVVLDENETEMGDRLIAVNLGTGHTVYKLICSSNEYVENNVCTACPPRTTNAAGDDATGADTTCDVILCAVNEYVESNVCTPCPAGTTNAAGDDASGHDTFCDAKQYSAACAGGYHACVIRDDRSTVCWGFNVFGQLGLDDREYAIGDGFDGDGNYNPMWGKRRLLTEMGDELVAVDFGTDGSGNDLTAKSVSCGYMHTCAVLSDDTLKCWGANWEGQLGLDHRYPIGTGYHFSLMMGNMLRAVDLGTDGNGNDLTAKSVSCGSVHTCAVLSDDTLKCWGHNEYGQLGLDHDYNIGAGSSYYEYDFWTRMGDAPPAVDLGTDGHGNDLTAKSVSCGHRHTCAVLSDNTLKCWGHNDYGQLGLDDSEYAIGAGNNFWTRMGDVLPAVNLGTDGNDNDLTAKSVSCGYEHTCAVLSDDTLKCWGNNDDGQLGLDHDYTIGDGYDHTMDQERRLLTEMGDASPPFSSALTVVAVISPPRAYRVDMSKRARC